MQTRTATAKQLVARPLRRRKIHELKERLRFHQGHHHRERLHAPHLDFDIPKGIIVGISGNAKTEWIAQFLAKQMHIKAAWIEETMTINPCALHQHRAGIDRILFSEAGQQMVWTTQQILQSQLFQIVVVTGLTTHDRALKRLQMLTENAGAILFLLNDQPYPAWPVALKLQAERDLQGEFQVSILKRRI